MDSRNFLAISLCFFCFFPNLSLSVRGQLCLFPFEAALFLLLERGLSSEHHRFAALQFENPTVLYIAVNVLSAIQSLKDEYDVFDGIFRCYEVLIAAFVVLAKTKWEFIIKFWKSLGRYWPNFEANEDGCSYRGWGLFRKSSYGEILLRLTYKAYVEDEEDDKAEAESTDIDALDCDDELPDSYVKEETEYSKEADKESFMDVLAALINQEYQDRLVLMMNPHPIVQNVPKDQPILACCDYKHIGANCDKYRWFKSFQSLILQCAA
ncbi:hypothetical protein FEM48_Zijuj10G0129600 [Ziziphus jujuba var. spinosa]|uniref:Uncharacterized protein n=1 Tax=Ziziphus jujuba var. spinosa TaxID=714518 RepID=A0A978UNI4_ZIZJJ|nr:hypothetical protein FEM48_Zijuj10G0129600 [Ziziphus jujuba var. spinosa]